MKRHILSACVFCVSIALVNLDALLKQSSQGAPQIGNKHSPGQRKKKQGHLTSEDPDALCQSRACYTWPMLS